MSLLRPYLKPNGKTDFIKVAVCQCGGASRGPLGGVCGKCCGAIPSVEEQRKINDRAWRNKCTDGTERRVLVAGPRG